MSTCGMWCSVTRSAVAYVSNTRYIPLECQDPLTRQNSNTSQKTWIFNHSAVRTSHLAHNTAVYHTWQPVRTSHLHTILPCTTRNNRDINAKCYWLPMRDSLVHLKWSAMRLTKTTKSKKWYAPAAGKYDDRPWPMKSIAKKLGTFSKGAKVANVLALSSQPWSPITGCTLLSPHHLPESIRTVHIRNSPFTLKILTIKFLFSIST